MCYNKRKRMGEQMDNIKELFEAYRKRLENDEWFTQFDWKIGEFTDTWFVWETEKYNAKRFYRLDEGCSLFLQNNLGEPVVAVRKYKADDLQTKEFISLQIDRICEDGEAIGIDVDFERFHEEKTLAISEETSRFMAQVSKEEAAFLEALNHEVQHYLKEESQWRLAFLMEPIQLKQSTYLQTLKE